VIFPPLGHDYRLAYPALKLLAERLASQGFAAIRFDYDGTGDSAGSNDDPDRVESWLRSGEHALRLIRSCGVQWTATVGMRVGASLAAMVAERTQDVDALVLWDPLAGRAYIAEQRALALLSFGATDVDDGSIELPGLVLATDTVQALREVALARTTGHLAEKVLCLTRADRPSDERMRKRLGDHDVEWGEADGQSDLLDRPPPDQIVPERAIDTISTWLTGAAPAEAAPVTVRGLRSEVWCDAAGEGLPFAESAFRTGTADLFGIVTEPLEWNGGPTVLLINSSNEHRIGPNRLWVLLARQWAQAGFRSVRFELSGFGDSGVWNDQERGMLRTREHFDDLRQMAQHVSPHDPSDVVLVGLCSSAYQAIDSAFDLKPRGICALNPTFSFSVPEMEASQPMDARRRVARHRNGFVTAFSRNHALWPLMERYPNALWFCRNLLSPRRPARWLDELIASDVVSFYLLGEYEARQLQYGSARRLSRLTTTGRLKVRVVPDLDHGLMTRKSRETAVEELTRHVFDRFLGPVNTRSRVK